eukprot:1198839-Pyramimonas_sp.AAC.1
MRKTQNPLHGCTGGERLLIKTGPELEAGELQNRNFPAQQIIDRMEAGSFLRRGSRGTGP